MPLDRSKVRELCDSAIRPMRHALWLTSWHVTLRYEHIEGDTLGVCQMGLAHQRATITIDPEKHDTKEDVLDTLRHELLHLTHGYFEQARQAVGQFLQGDPFDACDVAFTLGAEHTVAAIERLLDANGITPRRLVARGRKELGTKP